ncbi:hypothetical protein A7G45_09075 [Mycolicibacterium llatzerense]|nr:hypothetical protein [Mycolicibacterium llatzerense]
MRGRRALGKGVIHGAEVPDQLLAGSSVERCSENQLFGCLALIQRPGAPQHPVYAWLGGVEDLGDFTRAFAGQTESFGVAHLFDSVEALANLAYVGLVGDLFD